MQNGYLKGLKLKYRWGTKCHTLMVTIQLSTPANYFPDAISTQNNPISVVLIFSVLNQKYLQSTIFRAKINQKN